MLNEETIRRFIRTVGLESARELIDLFLEEARRRVDRMAGHVGAGNLTALEMEAHSLKGSAETYGVPSLGDMASEMESACRAGNSGRARDLMADIAGTAPVSLAALEAFVAAEI